MIDLSLTEQSPHKHTYDITRAKEIKVALTGERHTKFILLECGCGKKMCFPDDNFKLALTEGTEQTIKYLESLGV